MDLTDDFIDEDGMAAIRACGTRWTGHLAKAFQCIIKKFGIYLIYLKNFRKKGEKSKNIGRNFLQCQQMSRLSIPIFDLFTQLKQLWLGWQKKTNTAIDQESRLKKALKDLAMLKAICDNGKVLKLPYVQTRLKWWWLLNFNLNYV